MHRFTPVLEILRRHRPALYLGLLCILVTQAAYMTIPRLIQVAVDSLKVVPLDPDLVPRTALLVLGIAAVRAVSQYWMRWLIVGVSRKMESELRSRVFEHLSRLHFGWFDTARTGDVLSRLTADIEAVRMPVGPGIMYLVNTAVAVPAALAVMWSYSPRLTLLVLVPLAATAVFTKVFSPLVHRASVAMQEGQADLASRAQESFAGVRVVKSYAREEAEVAAFRAQGEDYSRRVLAFVKSRILMGPAFFLLEGAGMLLILWVGGGMVGRGEMTEGEFLAFNIYNLMLLWPMIALGWVVSLFQRGAASMDRINEVLDARPDVADAPGALPLHRPRGEVEVRNLDFSFGKGPPALRGISFRIPAGRTLAVIGPTGSGKSTLLSLLPRLYRVPDGTVFLDGADVNSIRLADLRRAVAVVPQETFLFSASIRENVGWGFEEGPPPGAAERAAEASRISVDVERFPGRFDTLLGERGVNLSGGQKQRVAIARALAMDAPVLVLDDCLSSVDAGTEEEILLNLREATRHRTTLLVSHRIAAVRHADEILFLEGGMIVERGTHEELLARGGRYADLARLQRLQGEIEAAS
ncbi:MAG: ABC transporter ATP-binding protein [Planctomycetaceae bacterium]|nr:ABC transporter ATP-binding protein/permease [Planctomycetota bacterium]NUN52365.1 ABC transporter ATP-binding protein [Planctomycetaceae bacterium]